MKSNDPLKIPTGRRGPSRAVIIIFGLFVALLFLSVLAPQPDLFEAIAEHQEI